MAATPESKVKLKVTAILKKYGVYFFYPATHGFGRSGVPDIICCVSGRFLAIECKAGKGKPTALQMHEIDSILSAGGSAIIINEVTLPEVELKLRAMLGDGGHL